MDWLLAIEETVAEAEQAKMPKQPGSAPSGPPGVREARINWREVEAEG